MWTLPNAPDMRIRLWHVAVMAMALIAFASVAGAQTGAAGAPAVPGRTILSALWKWTPALGEAFVTNILIGVCAMALGTVLGVLLGIVRLSPFIAVRAVANGLNAFLRNTPSLVFLFYLTFLLPAEFTIGETAYAIPGWIKATIGLAFPVIAFMSDNLLGAIRAVSTGQWDAGYALGYSSGQTLRAIVLPQTVTMMIPPWVNYFAIIIMASSTASMVGVSEILGAARVAIEAEDWSEFVIPMYLYVLLWFLAFCYPVSKLTVLLRARFAYTSS